MTLFSTGALRILNKHLDVHLSKMLNAQPRTFTEADLLAAYVRPADRDVLVLAKTLCGPFPQYQFKLNFITEGETVTGKLDAWTSFMTPHYAAALGYNNIVDMEAAAPILDWVANVQRMLREIVSLKSCIGYLNHRCSSPAQMLLFLPALRSFLQAKEDTNKDLSQWMWTFNPDIWGHKDFADFTRVRKKMLRDMGRNPPPVPRAIINECREANTLLLRCLMTLEGGEPEEAPGMSAQINMQSRAALSGNFSPDYVSCSADFIPTVSPKGFSGNENDLP